MVGVSDDASGPVQTPQNPYQPSAYPQQPDDPPPARRRRLWITLVAAWALLLLGLAVWSARNDPPSLRDQTTLASAKATIDATTAQVVAAVPTGWQVNDEGYRDSACELSLVRDGVATVRTITLSGPAGAEPAALAALAERLSAAVRPPSGPASSFSYDAGNYVLVRGNTGPAGTLVIQLTSGCRAKS
jgi:hypothetical protein